MRASRKAYGSNSFFQTYINNRAVEIHFSSDDETVVSVTAEEKKETKNNVDPWPHLKKVFQIHCRKNDKNVIYQCLAYFPISKKLSVNRRSYDNLKVHYMSVHPSSYAAFFKHLKNAKSLKQKSQNSLNRNRWSAAKATPSRSGLLKLFCSATPF